MSKSVTITTGKDYYYYNPKQGDIIGRQLVIKSKYITGQIQLTLKPLSRFKLIRFLQIKYYHIKFYIQKQQ